jgi:hypothetical protein
VRVEVCAPLTVAGFNTGALQPEAGETVALRETLPVNPLNAAVEIVKVEFEPGFAD